MKTKTLTILLSLTSLISIQAHADPGSCMRFATYSIEKAMGIAPGTLKEAKASLAKYVDLSNQNNGDFEDPRPYLTMCATKPKGGCDAFKIVTAKGDRDDEWQAQLPRKSWFFRFKLVGNGKDKKCQLESLDVDGRERIATQEDCKKLWADPKSPEVLPVVKTGRERFLATLKDACDHGRDFFPPAEKQKVAAPDGSSSSHSAGSAH